MSIWDDPKLQINDDYFSFHNMPHGTSIEGTLQSVEKQSFQDGSTAPKLNFINGIAAGQPFEELALTAGAIELRKLLNERRPEAGDYVKVTQTGGVKVGQGTKKLWSLEVSRPNSTPPSPVQQAAAANVQAALPGAGQPAQVQAQPAAVDAQAQAAAAALASLTPEQKAALGLS